VDKNYRKDEIGCIEDRHYIRFTQKWIGIIQMVEDVNREA
jgi:hypothetical protein